MIDELGECPHSSTRSTGSRFPSSFIRPWWAALLPVLLALAGAGLTAADTSPAPPSGHDIPDRTWVLLPLPPQHR
jgi:hypothetical protein